MSIMIQLENVPSHTPYAAAADVRQWVATGAHKISSRTVRHLASYFADVPDDAFNALAMLKPVEAESLIFGCLTIMRGPMVSVAEQQHLMALLAWVSWRYSVEARVIAIRRGAAQRSH